MGNYSIMAWRILWMTNPARVASDESATTAFSPQEIRVLTAVRETQRPRKGPNVIPDPSGYRLTVRDAVRTLAKLGGFIGRKSDGEPGIQTLWRGYRP